MRSKSTMRANIIGVATILASGIGAQSAAARWTPPSIDPGTIIRNSASFQLRSNTTETFTLRPQGLGQNANTLMSCAGFGVHGPGVSIDDAEANAFGPVDPPDDVIGPDGQVLRRIMPANPIFPQAERQPDGTYAIPDRAAQILADDNVGKPWGSWAAGCAAADWHAYDDDGHPTSAIMPHYPGSATGAAARKAKAKKAKAKKAHAKKSHAKKAKSRRHGRRAKARPRVAIGGGTATRTVTRSDPGVGLPAPGTVIGPEQEHVIIDSHSGPVTVELAGWHTTRDATRQELVVRITTGQLLGPTTLGLHGDVLRQDRQRTTVPEND
jgi:hypothetical protein